MKILFPVEIIYPSQAGGSANSVYWLAKNLARHGYQPCITATDKGISDQVELNRWLEGDAGRTIFLKTWSVHFPFVQTLVSLRQVLASDIVHLSSVFYPAAFFTGFAARLLGKKIVLSPRGELAEVALNHSAGRKRPILWAVKKILGTSPMFHSTSDREAADIRAIFGESARVHKIPNYVELEQQVPRRDGNYLLFMGRMHPQKALDNLIRALPLSDILSKTGAVLKIAGRERPENVRPIERLVAELALEDRVEFVGQVEGKEKLVLLARARATILPSHAENFGVVVVESLAQGTPVIASRGTPWESLETEKVGFWVGNSPESLAQAIDRMFRMGESEYEGYRLRSRAYVEKAFDIRSHIEDWLEFYRNLG